MIPSIVWDKAQTDIAAADATVGIEIHFLDRHVDGGHLEGFAVAFRVYNGIAGLPV